MASKSEKAFVVVKDRFFDNIEYFERRLDALNRRACFHRKEQCGIRARAEITGMLTVINALGFEAVGDWDKYLAKADVGFSTKLVYDIDLLAKIECDYNSRPADDRKKADLRYLVGLGYKW